MNRLLALFGMATGIWVISGNEIDRVGLGIIVFALGLILMGAQRDLDSERQDCRTLRRRRTA
jgi:hypothetical protein